MIGQLMTVLLCTTTYAVMRYAAFGGVSLVHLPGYLMNKSIAMAAVVSLLMAALSMASAQRDRHRFWSRACSHLISLHVLLSLVILSKGYFARWFEGDMMNLTGEGMLLMGVLAVYCFWQLAAGEFEHAAQRRLTLLAGTLVAAHLCIMGSGGWLQVDRWHGGLPPITLLSFVLVVFSLFSLLRVKARSAAPETGLPRTPS
ncbi:MAG: hypothetical protein A2075_11390 [Geobacteraceae bacterium GWC2_58_44]|nr:MAG: hypothetical protein A2075_11390 [Geobacteraceae bacterium GWC2_58_44]HBG04846.1 hypothetical protein [Geobacter sp.]